MRRDKTLKICANHFVTPWMELKPNCGSDRAWVWSVLADFADELLTPELLAIRFANAESKTLTVVNSIVSLSGFLKISKNSSFLIRKTKINANICPIFLLSHHTEYVKRESIVIAWVEKKNSFLLMNVHVLYVRTSKKKILSVSVGLSVCLSVCVSVCTWDFSVDTIIFERVSGSKQNLVGVFYVWNIGLVLKSKVKSWSWS